jgi:hypothetical protein
MLGFRLGSLPLLSYHPQECQSHLLHAQVISTLHWRLVFLWLTVVRSALVAAKEMIAGCYSLHGLLASHG